MCCSFPFFCTECMCCKRVVDEQHKDPEDQADEEPAQCLEEASVLIPILCPLHHELKFQSQAC